MSILEKFRHFAESLPIDRLNSVEFALAEIMESYSEAYDFSANEKEVIDQRLTESNPEFADRADVAKLFGKPFTA